MSTLNEKGHEVFDQTPVSYPIHFERPTPLHLRIRQQILAAMREMSSNTEFDTPEEADDFSIDDEPDFTSPYEMEENFDHITDPNVPLSEQGNLQSEKAEDAAANGAAPAAAAAS